MQPLRPVERVEGQAFGGRGEIEGRPQGKPHAGAVRLEARGEVQQVEEHLEERVAIGMPSGAQLLDQPLERHVLMRVGAERHLAHARQELAERRIAGEIRPQHQRVDEDAEQLVGARLVTAGDRRSHDQVLLPGVPEQQALERGEGGHEHRDALALAQPPEGAGHVGREHARAHRGLEGRCGRMWSVGRQIEQLGSAGQLTSPVGELRGERAVSEPRSLPLGEVRVLDRQRGEGKRPRLGQRRVRLGELAHEDGDRPAVEDGVMRRHREQVGIGREPQQRGANERPLSQVEGATGLLRGLTGALPPRARPASASTGPEWAPAAAWPRRPGQRRRRAPAASCAARRGVRPAWPAPARAARDPADRPAPAASGCCRRRCPARPDRRTTSWARTSTRA